MEEVRPQVRLKPQGAVREWFTYTTDGPLVVRLSRDEATRNAYYLNAVRAAKNAKSASAAQKLLSPFADAAALADIDGNEYIWETNWKKLKGQLLPPEREHYRLVR